MANNLLLKGFYLLKKAEVITTISLIGADKQIVQDIGTISDLIMRGKNISSTSDNDLYNYNILYKDNSFQFRINEDSISPTIIFSAFGR